MDIKSAIDATKDDANMNNVLAALLNEAVARLSRKELIAADLRKEANQILERARTLEGEAETAREQLVDAFTEKGITKITTGKYRISCRKDSKPTVNIVDEELVAEEFVIYKPVVKKDFILTFYLQKGKAPLGTYICQGHHLIIEPIWKGDKND